MAEKRKTYTSTAVKARYNDKTYDQIAFRVPKEMAAAFKEKCQQTGTPQAKVLKTAIQNFLAE